MAEASAGEPAGIIFDIKHYAIHDGPGIRATVFFKGCPLTCAWCHNPESLAGRPEVLQRPERCIGCGECLGVCPRRALAEGPGGILTDPQRCRACGSCASTCPAEARQMVGRPASVSRVMAAIEKDRPFFDQSGGGVTFSGGEPLQQAAFLLALLKACGRRAIHRAVDTSGHAATDTVLAVAAHTDLFLFDLKLMDPERYRRHTGVANHQILVNLKRLADRKAAIMVRIPLLPGINDDKTNLEQTGAFLAPLVSVQEVHLLPYHAAGQIKYARFGMGNSFNYLRPPEPNELAAAARHLERFDLRVHIGG